MSKLFKIVGITAVFILLIGLIIMQFISFGAINSIHNEVLSIDERITNVEQDIKQQPITVTPSVNPTNSNEYITIKLYYKNYKSDPDVMDCSAKDFVLRQVKNDDNLFLNTAKLLLTNELTATELNTGLIADYLDPDYAARKAKLSIDEITVANKIATVEISDPLQFTSGGSCRGGILASALVNTLKQFDEINSVNFLPTDELFQP